MKKRIEKFVVSVAIAVTFLAVVFGQTPDAARKADAQFVADYESAKKINQDISDATARAAARLEKENRPRRIQLEGLTAELQRKMAAACADVPQGCRYDEALRLFVPLPKPAGPPASTQPAPGVPEKPAASTPPVPAETEKK